MAASARSRLIVLTLLALFALSSAPLSAQLFTSEAVLSGDVVEAKWRKDEPVDFAVAFDAPLTDLSQFAIVIELGTDALDPGECLLVAFSGVGGAAGVCNISTVSQTTTTSTYPCSMFPDQCAAVSTGTASGQLIATTFVVDKHGRLKEKVSIEILSMTFIAEVPD